GRRSALSGAGPAGLGPLGPSPDTSRPGRSAGGLRDRLRGRPEGVRRQPRRAPGRRRTPRTAGVVEVTAAMTGLLGWRQRFLMQAAHRDDLDAHQIRTLVRQAVPDLDLDHVLGVLDEA